MDITEHVQHILNEAVYAPSGDNSQPWHFVWKEKALWVYNLPNRDNPIFNFQQRGSYIAHGALLENIRLVALRNGFAALSTYFPEHDNAQCIAKVTFTASEDAHEILSDYILQRCTNRKPYSTEPLAEPAKQALLGSVRPVEGVSLQFATGKEALQNLATAVSAAEHFMLEHKPLHHYFFSTIRWSEREEQQERSGLYVKTMELKPPQVAIFKLYSAWPIARVLNTIGMSAFIAKENAKIYARASAFIAFTCNTEGDRKYLHIGQALQRAWLTAAHLGLSLQPVGGVLYLGQHIRENSECAFSAKHVERISRADLVLHAAYNAKPGQILMLARVGQADPPTAHCSRKVPSLEIIP